MRAPSLIRVALASVALFGIVFPLVGGLLQAQARATGCDPRSFRTLRSEEAFGFRTTWVGLADVSCADGVRIRADSAVLYDGQGRSEFIGSFRYQYADREMRAGSADYFEFEGRLFARGDVEVLAADGTEVRGDTLTLYELGPGPDDDQIQVSGSPAFARLTSEEEPADGEAAIPFEVYGLRLRLEGERLFLADGDVESTRDSLHATSQALSFDRDAGSLRLTGDARVESTDAQFEGDVVELALPENELRSITLQGAGSLVSTDLQVRAEEIRIDVVEGGQIEHLVAVHRLPASDLTGGAPPDPTAPTVPPDPAAAGPPRPEGIARGFEITADSLDVVAPGGALQSLRAVGRARGVSRPETTETPPDTPPDTIDGSDAAAALERLGIDPSILEDDWIEGDTIVATFAPAAGSAEAGVADEDGGDDYVLEQLVAMGNARSIYRYPPDELGPDGEAVPRPDRSRWSINYVVADKITLTLVEGRVAGAEAEGAVVGGYLEPDADPIQADTIQSSDDVPSSDVAPGAGL